MSETKKLFENIQNNLNESYDIETILDSRSLWKKYHEVLMKNVNYIRDLLEKYEEKSPYKFDPYISIATLKYYPVWQRNFTPRCPYIAIELNILNNDIREYVGNKTEFKKLPDEQKQDVLNRVDNIIKELKSNKELVVNENDDIPIVFINRSPLIRVRLNLDTINLE